MESHAENIDENEFTHGQTTNEAWYEMRIGLLTASYFQKAVKYIDDKEKRKTWLVKCTSGYSVDNTGVLQ